MNNDKLVIIIPSRNEEKNMTDIIKKCRRYSDDILVVDGHSTDKTKEVAQQCGARVVLDNKKGKGDAIRTGIAHAQKEVIVFIDADGSHDPDDIPRMVEPILKGEADLVTGSRMRGGSDELHGDFAKFIRMMGSDIITLGINYRFHVKLTDSQNGFRALRRDVALALNLRENITTIEQEMTIKALRKGFRVAEIAAHEYERKYGNSSINVGRVWFRYVYTWIKYLFWG